MSKKRKSNDKELDDSDFAMDKSIAYDETDRSLDDGNELYGISEDLGSDIITWPLKLISILTNLQKFENEFLADYHDFKRRNKNPKRLPKFTRNPGVKDSTLNSRIKEEVAKSSRTPQIQPLLSWMLEKELIKETNSSNNKEIIYRIDIKGTNLARIFQTSKLEDLSKALNECGVSMFILVNLLRGMP